MTVNEMFKNALALTLETPQDNTDFEEFILPHFNLLLIELLAVNNEARRRNGREPLKYAPAVTDKETECPYEQELWGAMVYGLAAKLLIADENDLAGTYLQQYYAMVNSALPISFERVDDIFEQDYD